MEKIIFLGLSIPILGFVLYLGGNAIMNGFKAKVDNRSKETTENEIEDILSNNDQLSDELKKLNDLAAKRGNVKFISHIPQNEVFLHMMEAKVNVLTSWVETPGLVSLEAVYAKCNIVVSDKGTVRDYFKDYAFYCTPDNIRDIRNTVQKAMKSKFNEDFRTLIKTDYSWHNTALQTITAYRKILNN